MVSDFTVGLPSSGGDGHIHYSVNGGATTMQYDTNHIQLTNLANESLNKYPISDLFCKHRVGKVKVGETSLHVIIWSKHRKEGFKALAYFISELKKRIPIWKWAILEDGTKIPSECSHH